VEADVERPRLGDVEAGEVVPIGAAMGEGGHSTPPSLPLPRLRPF